METNGWKPVIQAVLVALIVAVPPTILAWSARIKVDETHDLINSRMTELLKSEIAKAIAEATLKEKAREKARQGAAAEAELKQQHELPNRIAKEPRK